MMITIVLVLVVTKHTNDQRDQCSNGWHAYAESNKFKSRDVGIVAA